MHLELRFITHANQMPPFIDCYLRSFADPFSPHITLEAPKYPAYPGAYEDRVMSLSTRHWFDFSAHRNSRLPVVVDTESNDMIVGGARWNIYREHPFKDDRPHTAAYWWPPGAMKRYIDALLRRLSERRDMGTPHMLCCYTFTHPGYRKHGVGDIMMKWATQQADEMGLEMFVETSLFGCSFFERHGFIARDYLTPMAHSEVDDPDSRAWREAVQNHYYAVMRRPVPRDSGVAGEGLPLQ